MYILLFNCEVVSNSLWPMDCSMPGFSVLHHLPSLLKHMSIESVMLSNHLAFSRSLLLLRSISPNIRVFSNESVLCIRWPKYWSFSISSSNEYSGLISCKTDWFDLLAVQETLKGLLQHHSSKASILWCSAFFMIQLSHLWLLDKPWLWLYRLLSAMFLLKYLLGFQLGLYWIYR